MPAPDPATPTVAAPAPINLAAVSMSREITLVWKSRLATWRGELLQEGCLDGTSGRLKREADTGLIRPLVQERICKIQKMYRSKPGKKKTKDQNPTEVTRVVENSPINFKVN